jgi:two-component system, response regulator PdtaR
VFETASSTGWDTGALAPQPRGGGGHTTLAGVLRVCVAEDEAIIRMDLVEILTEAGYEVAGSVGDGEAAVELVDTCKPDVLLVDIAMPRLDGLAVTRQVAARTAVVVITAFEQPALIDEATRAGAMGYLVKPVGRGDVQAAVEIAAGRWAMTAQLSAEVADLQQRLADRRDVDRAKAQLMREGMAEDLAYAELRRRAMDARATLGDVARELLADHQ